MSCEGKLKNLPKQSPIDQKTKQMVPSALTNVSIGQRIAIATKNVTDLAKNIALQVANEVNNAIDAITGKIGATVKAIEGIGTNIKNVQQNFLNSAKKVGQSLAAQAQAVTDLIDCEITTFKDNITATFEASELQSNITTAAAATGGGITNNMAKTFSENPAAKQAYIDAQTKNVQTKTVNSVATTQSNATVNKQQVTTVKKLEAVPAVTTPKKPMSRLDRLNYLRREKSGPFWFSYSAAEKKQIEAEIKYLEAGNNPPFPG